jgi:GntR family transcriptional regulator
LIVRVDPAGPVAPYEQIRMQVAAMVHSRTLIPGYRLPPIRQLAADLGIAAGTVARSYRELERDGLVETRGRHGTFVTEPPRLGAAEVRRALVEAARAFAVTALQLGVDREDAVRIVSEAYDETDRAVTEEWAAERK